MLLMFTCGICIEGRMLIYLHAVLALEEGCCCHVYMWYLSWRKDVVDVYMWYLH